jgi:hypothetical protein
MRQSGKDGPVKVTVNPLDQLYRRSKIKAAKDGVTVTSIIADFLLVRGFAVAKPFG